MLYVLYTALLQQSKLEERTYEDNHKEEKNIFTVLCIWIENKSACVSGAA